MFGKKKEIQTTQDDKHIRDYTTWEKDFGFLLLILSRKKGITKEFLISIYDKQKKDKDYLTDEELEPIITKVVEEVVSQVGENYKKFLIEKYFGTEANFISFITEDVYVDLVSDAIKRNSKKITTTVQNNLLKSLGHLNKGKSEK